MKRFWAASPGGSTRSQTMTVEKEAKRRPPAKANYFGVPLEEIIQRERQLVPNLVTKTAAFIIDKGAVCYFAVYYGQFRCVRITVRNLVVGCIKVEGV